MHHLIRRLLYLAILSSSYLCPATAAHAKESTLYIGTYTRGTDSRGIYVYRFDDQTGALSEASVATGADNPSFLAISPDKRFVFSADEVDAFNGQDEGAVTAWSIDGDSGKLELLNRQGSGGAGPCHLSVDPAGRHVLVANYAGGTIAVLQVDADGKLQPAATRIKHHGSGLDTARQTSPHPHEIILDPSGHFAFVPDLGLDKIFFYRYDAATGALTPNDPPFVATAPGAGPRHLAFSPDGNHAYSINELDLTITTFDYNADRGLLRPRETRSTISEDADRNGVSGAEIAVHPSGRFLYGSLRGTDEIVAYHIDKATGELKFIERITTGGKTPRNFTIDPTGKWLLAANQNSASITAFRIEDDGLLTATSQHATVPAPVCLAFLKR